MLFRHLLEVCFLTSIIVPINTYVLFAANLDDFRNLAKKLVPEELAEKLTDLVKQNGRNLTEKNVDNVFRQKNTRNKPTAFKTDEASPEITMYRIGDENNRQKKQSNPRGRIRGDTMKRRPSKFDYDEEQNTNNNGKSSRYEETGTMQNTYARQRPVRVERENDEGRYEKKQVIQIELDKERETNRPRYPTRERERMFSTDVTKKPRDDIFEDDSNTKNDPSLHQQENWRSAENDRFYKKRNLGNQFGREEKQNSYLKERPRNQNDDDEKVSKIGQSGSVFEHEGEKQTETNVRPIRNDYDYRDTTTRSVTLEENQYRTVKSNRIIKSLNEQFSSNTKDELDRSINLRETYYLKQDNGGRVVAKNKRILTPDLGVRDRDSDIQQIKITPKDNIEFENIEPKAQGKVNGMRITNEQRQIPMQEDIAYEKPFLTKPTTNDEGLLYEKRLLSKPTDVESRYENTRVIKPNTNNEQVGPIKGDDYYYEANLKQAVKPTRNPKVNMQPKQYDIFTSSENTNTPVKNNKNIDKRLEKRPDNEQEPDLYAEVVQEPVKARTERLNFDVDYDNITGGHDTTRHLLKGTGIPTREVYRMSSPDYYKKLPRIVEKYDFNEPIPEADRVREVPDDKLVIEPGRVNMKVRQQNRDKETNEDKVQTPELKQNIAQQNGKSGDMMEVFPLAR